MKQDHLSVVLGAGLALAVMERSHAAQPGEKLWEFPTGSGNAIVRATPAISAEGIVVVGSTDWKIYGLDGTTGQKRWELGTRGEVRSAAAIGADGTAHVGSADGRVYAINAGTGVPLWSYYVGSEVLSSPALGEDGTVYVAAGKLYALSGATGQKRWEFAAANGVNSSPAVGPDGTVYAGSDKLYALSGSTGQKRWEFDPVGWVSLNPVIGLDGVVYVGSSDSQVFNDGRVYAMNGATGQKLWEVETGRFDGSEEVSPAVRADGTVFAGRFALDGITGQPLWDTDAVLGCPAIGADGTIYAVVRSYPDMGSFWAISGTTGKRLWRCETGWSSSFSAPALGDNGVLYVGTYRGSVCAFQATSGLAQGPWTKLRGNAQNTGRLAVSAGPAVITEQPLDVRVAVGKPFRLWVWASGSAPIALQWYRNGQPVPGGTASVLRVAEAQLTDADEYVATAANALGSATSHVARVVVGYSLEVVVAGSGTVRVDPPLEVYEPGQSVQLAAVPADGRAFLGWQGDATGISNPLTLAMDRSKQVQAIFSANPGDLRWEFTMRRPAAFTPALGQDGTVYVGSERDAFYALDGVTGQKRWEFRTGGGVASAAAIGANGIVYVGFAGAGLCALNGESGEKVWEFESESGVSSGAAIGADGMVCFGSGSELVALDGETGQERWTFRAAHTIRTEPAIGADGTVYIGADNDLLYAVSAANGQMRWSFHPCGYGSPAVGVGEIVYVGASDGRVVALDGLTGQVRWAFPTPGRVETPAIGADGTVYVGVYMSSGPSRVYALDGLTGEKRWEFLSGGGLESPAIGADGTVYVGSFQGPIFALAGGTGEKRWEFAAQAYSSPAIGADGTVYVGSHHGRLYALGSTSAGGLAASPWPKYQSDAKHSGRSGATPPTGVPVMALEPEDRQCFAGANAHFAAWARGTLPLAYRWYKDGLPLAGNSRITGVASERLSLTNVQALDIGRYHVVVSNTFGSVTSRVATLVVPELAGQKRWEFQTGGLISSCPALGWDGTVYVSSRDTKLYALDGATGAMRWQYQTGGEVVASPAVGTDGTVFVGSVDTKIYALDGATGQKRWDFPTGGAVVTSAAIGTDGTIFVGAAPDRLYALNPVTGQTRWEYRTGRGVSSPAIGLEGRVYVGSQGSWMSTGAMYALDGANGQKLWEFQTEGSVESPVVGLDGTLYFPATELAFGPPPFYESLAVLKVYALDGATGHVRWSARREHDSAASSPVISAKGKAFLSSTGDMAWPGVVYAFDLVSGQMSEWFRDEGKYNSSPAIAADGTIYIGAWGLYALASSDAEPIWESSEGGGAAAPAIGTDGTVYCGIGDKLFAFYGSSELAQSPWPKSRGDAQNTGRVGIPPPLRLTISWDLEEVRVEWSPPAVLQSSDRLAPADWQDVIGAASPYEVEPANAQRFYRLRRPRRAGSTAVQ